MLVLGVVAILLVLLTVRVSELSARQLTLERYLARCTATDIDLEDP